MTLIEILKLAPVVPVLIIEDEAHAVPLARALVAGGLYALEVTLRTPVALHCVRRIAGRVASYRSVSVWLTIPVEDLTFSPPIVPETTTCPIV